MSASYDPSELDRLLDEALERPAGERDTFVRRAAAGRPALLAAAEQVLREAAAADGFLDPQAAAGLRDAVLATLAAAEEPQSLAPGDAFTSFTVRELVGRGGMGEVYRAEDSRLGRDVALKVLPRAFLEDSHRRARFEREARVLASLNHPNIGTIYGLAEDGGRQALVLEFVEGPTLAARIEAGPLPVRDVIAIARQVVLALEAAHRRGIVHRDLKPGNIVVTADGTVKVLDFGLAKAARGDGSDSVVSSVIVPGAVLGTPAYMSPEQAEGRAVDHRTDVWAFGCIVFEMLAGVRPLGGNEPGEALVRLLQREPDFSRLPPGTPEPLKRLLRRTLAKDPERRLDQIGAALADLEAAGRTREGWRRWRVPAVAAMALAGLVLAGIAARGLPFSPWRARPPAERLAIPISPREQLLASVQQVAAISPDGRTLVYRAIRDGRVGLFSRTIGELESRLLPGTENAAGPFFSPDGRWLGFDGDGVLRKVALAGGAPVTIGEAPGGASASWGDRTIVFSTTTARHLQRVPAGGGHPEPLTALDRTAGDLAHAFPFVLPRGDAVLFTIVRESASYIAVVRLAGGDVRVLLPGSQPRYVSTGHLVFARDSTLWAVPFDERGLQTAGEPQPVVEHVETAGGSAAQFAIAQDGTLVYAPRREEVPERALVWVNAAGAEAAVPVEPKRYARAALSPDGRLVALAASEAGNTDIWVADMAGGTMQRLTRAPTLETAPLWSPDGRTIVFRSDREGGGLFSLDANGRGTAERLTSAGDTIHTPHGFTPDGRTVLFTIFRSYADQAIAAVDLRRPLIVRPLVEAPGAQLRPQVSPDGRWLAYQSDESGHFEIYVRAFSDPAQPAIQVSRGGGTSPRWADAGRLLYYDGRGLSRVTLPAPGSAPAPPERLFAYSPFGGRLGPEYDVAPDGERFLFIRPASDTPSSRVQLLVVRHWFTELRERLEAR